MVFHSTFFFPLRILIRSFYAFSHSLHYIWSLRMLSSVNFDLYFSFWRWSSVNYSKQNTENDWKLPGQALFIVRWLERNWPLHWKIPKCLCLLSGGCSFSLETNPYIPIFLNYWRRTWKENLERVSHPLLSDLNLIYLFMALFFFYPCVADP